MKEIIDLYFFKIGYRKYDTSLPEICMYCREEAAAVNAVQFIYFDERSSTILEEDMDFLYKKGYEFLTENYRRLDVHLLTVFVTNNTVDNYGYVLGRTNSWILVPGLHSFIVPEGHIEEFYGIKAGLEAAFNEPEALKQEMTRASETVQPNGTHPYGREEQKRPVKRLRGKLPVVTISIVSLNVILFIVYAFCGEVLYNKFNLNWYDVMVNHEYYRFLTAIFMHADIQHLSGNLIMLYVVMETIEKNIGHLRTLLYYMLAGLGGGIASVTYAYMSGEIITSIGASGAYFGMAGVLLVLMMLYRSNNRGLIMRFVFMLGYSLYCGFTSIAVDNAAHVGGLVVGLVLSFAIEGIKRLRR